MLLIKEIISNSEFETASFAKECITMFNSGSVIELIGDLGTGKTFFVKSFCNELGINNSSSPSFSIVNQYNGEKLIYHFDFYRIKKTEELLDIGFYDYINDETAITFIEWGNLFEEVLPGKRFVIRFNTLDPEKRKITLYKNG